MSCEIRLTATICDISAIRRCLFPTDDLRGSDTWLQQCEISVSPTGDLIALANERRLVILAAKWDSNTSINHFTILYSGSIHESDNIKAVLCLPVVSQSKSSHAMPDFSCILIGFESGYLRFYTENCELLFEEQLHNEVITTIKCQSQHNPRPDVCPNLHREEIYVQYQSNVCVINGNQLFLYLRINRSELARAQARGEVANAFQESLHPRKWGFTDQAQINDIGVVGVNLHSTFDHLLTASTCGGYDSKYRSTAPLNNLVLAAGSRPFVGFHYAMEGVPQPVLSDVAEAVASKLKSALPNWLTGVNKSQAEKQVTTVMKPIDPMGCRFGLCDLRRTAKRIILSWDHKLAAISDELGRVILMDAYRGIALRIFKGYRDAQCSFIQVPDERLSKHRLGNKVALFLAIYSPKKGTLEIFTVQDGSRITIFTASKFSKLLYINYNLMGFTTTTKSRYTCQFTTVFIDNDGSIKEILVPFHYALSEQNNSRPRDIHLFKKMKKQLKYGELTTVEMSEEFYNICTELQTNELKQQTVELLTNNRNVPANVILKCVQYFAGQFQGEDDDNNNSFKILVDNCCILVKFYMYMCEEESNDEDNSSTMSEATFNLDDGQLVKLQKFLDLNTLNDNSKDNDVKVTFSDLTDITPSQFLSVFDLNDPLAIKLKPYEDSELFQISEALFHKFIVGGLSQNFVNFQKEVVASNILIENLFKLVVIYWVNRPLININLEKEMGNLFNLIVALVKTADRSDVTVDYGETSRFWNEIRTILSNSARPFPALTAAMLCKTVAQKIEQEKDADIDEMEVLSQENVEWSLLIGKLEDVSLLNLILANQPTAVDCPLPKLSFNQIDVSLRYVLEKGKGSVSELVAQWLSACGVSPENIVFNDILYRKVHEDDESSFEAIYDDDDLPEPEIMPHQIETIRQSPVFDRLNVIKEQFPYSLDANMLLTNLCWEYGLAWHKDIQDLAKLEACISCLKHIPSSHLREGLCLLVWNTHLKMIFESTAKLINKVGKLPKEKLCRQDTGLSDCQIPLFLSVCRQFFDFYMDAAQESNDKVKPQLYFEQIWENGPQALVELALQQNPVNYALIQLHYQLSMALELLIVSSIKFSKPINNLFEPFKTNLFFVELQTSIQINWEYNDTKILMSRLQFLCKTITASLEHVTVDENKVYANEHRNIMDKCLAIGELWNLDSDELRRHQVVEIYRNGLNLFGDEEYKCVRDKWKLGPHLLAIAGRRLAQFFTNSPNYCQNVTAFTPAVTRYIEALEEQWCAPSNLKGIENLVRKSMPYVDDESKRMPENKIARMFLDGLETLFSLYKEEEC